jgi:hypothetical protein
MVELRVEIDGRFIVVTMPGTSFRSRYFLNSEYPGVLETEPMTNDMEASLARQEFEVMAWEADHLGARFRRDIPQGRAGKS